MTSSDRSSSTSRRRTGARRKRAPPKDEARADPQLKPRTSLTQRRAESTIHLILETASVLIDEVGLHVMTRNLIAKRAPVRVSTVFRYFPNKLAVVAALSNRLDAARVLLVSAGAVLKSAGLRESPRDIDIIDDMHAMHEAFLADYLD